VAALDDDPGAPQAGALRGPSFDGVIFDLDGTLVDTLEDIADAMDRVLALEGASGHAYDEYRYLIGHGIRSLVTQSLPEELRDEATVERCYERMIADYGEHSLVKTRVYDGVPELVRALRADGVPLAVHSNKSETLTQDIVAALLRPSDFVVVAGARADAPLKPDPAVALAIAARFGLPPARVAYVGDSLVDMRTGTAAGMLPVGASWGFRTPAELLESGARLVIDHPLELLVLRG
jgi:phosphoglycolate phosphatase